MNPHLNQISQLLGTPIQQVRPLHGGNIADVYGLTLADGRAIVAKVTSGTTGNLHIEGDMLRYLRQHSQLPVPDVLHSAPDMLLLSHIPGDSTLDTSVQEHAAELLAALHQVRAPRYGLPFATLIGGLHQPNDEHDSWVAFFREMRLRYMAHQAHDAGELPTALLNRIEQFATRLDEWLHEPAFPALIHGDMWTTNILAQAGQVTGFIDPAIYYAHPEIELAFSTLFGTFNDAFFRHYTALNPLAPGFFETRRDIYNLYPLLVHVRLFGGGYVSGVDRILRRFGA
jgi:fructosamine-3-kinase